MIRVHCPICDRAMESEGTAGWPDLPFCSSRCRLIDLGRWLGEGYRIPSQDLDESPAEDDDPCPFP